jgi:uncharacterized protein with von Willebrand factor type A (vWA) domain
MTTSEPSARFLWTLFQQLRRRNFPLSPADYEALRTAMRAGFGWSSRSALRDLCCALWAKSRQEAEVVTALFAQFDEAQVADWSLAAAPESTQTEEYLTSGPGQAKPSIDASTSEDAPTTQSYATLPAISLQGVVVVARPFVFVPQFPLSYREIVQATRRLRRPTRWGPPTELDLAATIARRSQAGVATPVVLRPPRRNTVRLLLLIDRQGSMAPFHRFCQEICTAMQEAGRLAQVATYYFHDTPATGADESPLMHLHDQLFPVLDAVLPQIKPLSAGYVYTDPDLLALQPVTTMLEEDARGAAVLILSDAGAARGRYDARRLLDTLAFCKALRGVALHYVWLNPLPRRYWLNNTAGQLARHIPMFALDRLGLYQAVSILRGQPPTLERPL